MAVGSKRMKSVSFPKEEEKLRKIVGYVPNRQDMEEEEMTQLYFTKQDFAEIRRDSKLVSMEVERKGYSKHLDDAFSEKNSKAQKELNKWVMEGGKARGLERWSNRDHGESREGDQFHTLMAMLGAQDEMLAEEKHVDPEKLRKIAYKTSRVARHFARMMGKADSHAVENLEDTEDSKSAKTASTHQSTLISVGTDEDSIAIARIKSSKEDNTPLSLSKKFRKSKLSGLLWSRRGRSKARQEGAAEADFNAWHHNPVSYNI